MERKPLAPALSRNSERRDIRRTFRFSETEDAEMQEGAVDEREEFSEYCRACMLMGHGIRRAQRLSRRTSA